MEIITHKLLQNFKNAAKFTAFSLLLIFTYNTCTEEPNNPEDPPQKADCPNGFLPCEEDSTACCEVICPPGTLLGGQDSTECIPVVCPEYHHLCGPDSTDCCLDTTSHDMIWEIDTIFTGIVNWGEDVEIINESKIWVVGRFEYDGSTDLYNLIEWNGNDWIVKTFIPINNNSPSMIDCIFSFSENDIWFGGSPYHWDGEVLISHASQFPTGFFDVDSHINEIWGSGPNDVFFIGNKGRIAHWDGNEYTMVTTQTDLPLVDIWGSGPNDVWVIGWNDYIGRNVILHYNGSQWTNVYQTGSGPPYTNKESYLTGDLTGVQVFKENEAFILGLPYGIYRTTLDSVPYADLIEIEYTGKNIRLIRGNHPNDIYVAANHSGIYHFNGNSIYEYDIPGSGDLFMKGMDVKGGMVVIMGYEFYGDNLIVLRGNKVNE